MAQVSINGKSRNEFGKGASRRTRKQDLVPGVIYGHNQDPIHVSIPVKELTVALKTSNVLIDLTFDRGDKSIEVNA